MISAEQEKKLIEISELMKKETEKLSNIVNEFNKNKEIILNGELVREFVTVEVLEKQLDMAKILLNGVEDIGQHKHALIEEPREELINAYSEYMYMINMFEINHE